MGFPEGFVVNKANILFISHNSSLYGAQKSLVDLVLGLDPKMFNSEILVNDYGDLTKVFEIESIKFDKINFRWWVANKRNRKILLRSWKNFKCLIALLKLNKQKKFDIIYTNTSTVPIGALVSLFTKIPHVWHIREFLEEDYSLKFDFGFKLSSYFINKSSKRIIFNSKAVLQKYSKTISPDKLSIIYNGPLKEEAYLPDFKGRELARKSKYSICMIGNISKSKGQILGVATLKTLIEKEGLDVYLHIVGSGSPQEVERVSSLAHQLGIEERVFFEGYCEDVKPFLSEADVCWVCSTAEAFGRVVVESMSVGTPVVASASGGVPEIIDDRRTGLLFPDGDADVLAEKTVSLLCDSELYRSISREGYREVFMRFSRDRYVAEISSVLTSVLAGK